MPLFVLPTCAYTLLWMIFSCVGMGRVHWYAKLAPSPVAHNVCKCKIQR